MLFWDSHSCVFTSLLNESNPSPNKQKIDTQPNGSFLLFQFCLIVELLLIGILIFGLIVVQFTHVLNHL